jgi:hypothetical protein
MDHPRPDGPHARATPPAGPDHPDAADPLAALLVPLAGAWRALRLHLTILGEEAAGRFYGLLTSAAVAVIGVCSILLLTMLGGYFLISGVALGLANLFASEALGRALAGVVFLVCPLLLGLGVVSVLRRGRERRLIADHAALHAQGAAP